eukprot:TRINITY_DN5825_c0_g1_i1.p1 TRINITY_DN5825_c0_g1~~TRINITY_DN5825_c0_g1_i1.p1  ORF type:complete len:520 (-),score=99.36 TRINITY_DN5825_c0_g1_i1:266-1825(-)
MYPQPRLLSSPSALPPDDVARIVQMSGDVLTTEYKFHRVLRDGDRSAIYHAQLVDTQQFVVVKRLKWLKNFDIMSVHKATGPELYPRETDSPFVLKPLAVTLNSQGSIDVISPLCSCDLESFLRHDLSKVPESVRVAFVEETFPLLSTIIVQGLGSLSIHDIQYPDMKLSNVFLRFQDEPLPTVAISPGLYIGDFEHALRFGRNEKALVSYGTLGYAPPEMMNEKYTHINSSAFSIAQTLYQFRVGRFYVRGKVAEEIPASYRAVLQSMLKPDPENRPNLLDLIRDPLFSVQDAVPKFMQAVAKLKDATAEKYSALYQTRSVAAGSGSVGSIDKIRFSRINYPQDPPAFGSQASSHPNEGVSIDAWKVDNIVFSNSQEALELKDAVAKHYIDLLMCVPEEKSPSDAVKHLIASVRKPTFVGWFENIVRDFTELVWQEKRSLASKWNRATISCYLTCCFGVFRVGKAHFVEEFKQSVLPTLSAQAQSQFEHTLRRQDQLALGSSFEGFWSANREKYLAAL